MAAEANAEAVLDNLCALPLPADNAYYDPARSGHGVFLGQGAGQWVAYWYTYLQDGTPAWYLAQAALPAPNAAAFRNSPPRFSWSLTPSRASTGRGPAASRR